MSVCINKSHPNFKAMSAVYGENLAEAFIRKYSSDVKALSGDFYYPSVKEFKSWMMYFKRDAFNVLNFALEQNPNLSKEAILSLLKGVVHKHKGDIFITKGWTDSGSMVLSTEQLETVYKPNLRIMVDLATKYPNIFKVKDTRKPMVKVVEITAPSSVVSSNVEVKTSYGPDTKVREKYFSTGKIQKIKTVLEKMAASAHPLNIVAKKLIEYADVNNVDIEIVDKYSFDELRSSKLYTVPAFYTPNRNKIFIAGRANVTYGLYEKVILHEILHALSYRELKSNQQASLDFKKLYDAAVEKIGKWDPQAGTGYYALKNEDEFFVALFTDSDFIKKLQSVPAVNGVKYTNLFEEIIAYILKILKLDASENLYRQAFSVATNILEEQRQMSIVMAEQAKELEAIEKSRTFDDYYQPDVSSMEESVAFQQKESLPSSKASPKVIALVKDLLKNMGVNYEGVKNIVVNGKKIDANGIAKIMEGLVQVVEGKEETTLPEETMHFLVAIIKQTNPALYKKLMSEINDYRMKSRVFDEYGTDPAYQIDGKPNVIKLKEEAIAKVLVEKIINSKEGSTEKPENLAKVQSWWRTILNYIKSLFAKSGFDQVAFDIISGKKFGKASDIREQEGEYYLQQSEQDRLYNLLKNAHLTVDKRGSEDGYYDKVTGRKIPRVTDIVKTWYDQVFADKALTDSEWTKAVNDLKKEKGTAGHLDFEEAFKLFVDEDGYLRDVPLDDSSYISQINPDDRAMYETLKNNLYQRLLYFNNNPGGGKTRFLSETIIYNSKTTNGLAGTVDFIAIRPNGKVAVLDWKFVGLNEYQEATDIPWYKINAWQQQMDAYMNIFERMYGVKANMIEQARMIPIIAMYSKGDAINNIYPELIGVSIGDVEAKNILDPYLLPVGIERESTGNKRIDRLIEKLNNIYKGISEKKALPSEKQGKAEQLNALFFAIRQLQMRQNIAPLIEQSSIYNKKVKFIIDVYRNKFEGKDPSSFSDKEINDLSNDIETAIYSLTLYTELDTELKSLFRKSGEPLSDEEKALEKELNDSVSEARLLLSDLKEVDEEFTNDIVAGKEGVMGAINPERSVKGVAKWFSSTSVMQIKSVEALYKKINRALFYAKADATDETSILTGIKERYDKWAKSKGLTLRNYFDMIRKTPEIYKKQADERRRNDIAELDKNKANLSEEGYKQALEKIESNYAQNLSDRNELIDEFSPEFYTTLKKKIQERDFNWIRQNVNREAYASYLQEQKEKEYLRIEGKPENFLLEDTPANEDANNKIRANIKFQKAKVDKQYDISQADSIGWLLYKDIKKFPNKSWESEQWKELNKPENAPALEFYNYIKRKNEEYTEFGYLSKAEARVFLPWVRKDLSEKLFIGGKISLGEQFFRSISVDQGDVGLGKLDFKTGKPIQKIPKYFTSEIEGEISVDLFRTMALYNEMALRFKYLSEMEYQARALVNLEKNKKAIATTWWGKTRVKPNGETEYTRDNSVNTQIIEDMTSAILYGQKFLESETFDVLLGKMGDWAKKINDKLGVKLFDENMSERQISLNKVINNINNTFQLITLGVNPLSALSNLFGGTAQSVINSGKWFTKGDFVASSTWIFQNKMMGGENRDKYIAALDYFLPLTEDQTKQLAKKLSINQLSQENIQEFIMALMRNSDIAVQVTNFWSFLKNTIVEDGVLKNAREELRKTEKYANKFNVGVEERKNLEQEFEEDVKKLLEEKGVLKLSRVEDGKLVIPGVERKSESVVKIRRTVQALTKDALGNLSEDDVRLINLNIYGKSFMVFKNWIPRQVDVRYGALKYNSGSDAYEWGRMRTTFRFLATDTWNALGSLKSAIFGNDEKMIGKIRELYEEKSKKYKEETGKDLNMDEVQFIELVRSNIKAQMVDTVFLLTLMSLFLALKAYEPEEDEDPVVRNQYKFLLRATDKLRDEIKYFYDPTSIQGLISRGIFPSMQLLVNYKKLLDNFSQEMFGMAIGDEEMQEKAYPVKYLMKSFPVLNVGQSYLPMFFPDLAKDLNIKVQSQSGIR